MRLQGQPNHASALHCRLLSVYHELVTITIQFQNLLHALVINMYIKTIKPGKSIFLNYIIQGGGLSFWRDRRGTLLEIFQDYEKK